MKISDGLSGSDEVRSKGKPQDTYDDLAVKCKMQWHKICSGSGTDGLLIRKKVILTDKPFRLTSMSLNFADLSY